MSVLNSRNTTWRLLLLFVPLITQPAVAAAETLSFAQCVEIALRQNPDLSASQAQVEQAEAGLRQARGSRFPKLTASLIATRTNDALNAFGIKLSQRQATFNDFGAGQFNPSSLFIAPDNLNYPGNVNNFNTRLEAQLPIYTGGMIEGNIEQAKALIRAAQSGDVAARQKLIYQVLQAYQGVHSARAMVAVAKQAEIAANSQVKTITSLVNGGVVVKSDLLSAQVRQQDTRIQLLQAQNTEATAVDQLHLLLGIPLATPLDVGTSVMTPASTGSSSDLQQQALTGNPGVQALRSQVEAAQASVKVSKASLYPQLGLMARQDWNDSKLGFAANSYTVAGSLTWTVFDGKVTQSAVDRAAAGRNEQAARLQQAENTVAAEVARARRQSAEAEFSLAAREQAVESAEQATRLVDKRYANGVATITELLAAQTQLDKTRADVVRAQYELAVQRASLLLALGQLDPAQY
jgi:outer membrane protein